MNRDRDRDREDHDQDQDHEYGDRPRRTPRVEIRYIFAVNRGPAPTSIHGSHFYQGQIISTSDGPHKVVEVFWITVSKARVLLRPLPPEKKPEPEKKSKKSKPAPVSKPKRRFPNRSR